MSIISVIVPVGNGLDFLIEAMDSIRKQTLKNIEIICIDDATTDGSGEFLDSVSMIDSRCKVFHMKDKVGAARARNMGLEVAVSPYVIFLDSDDFFELDMLEHMYTQIVKYQADVSMVKFDIYDMNQKTEIPKVSRRMCTMEECTIFHVKEASDDILLDLPFAPWNKLIRKELLIQNDIQFQDIEAANDVYFSTMVHLLAKKIVYSWNAEPKIHYRTNTNMQISSRRTPLHVHEAFNYLRKQLLERNIWDLYGTKVSNSYFFTIVNEIFYCKDLKIRKDAWKLFQTKGMKCFELSNISKYEKLIYEIEKDMFDINDMKQSIILWIQLELKKQKVLDLCAYINDTKQNWTFWGAGKINNTIVQFIEKKCIDISYKFVDNDEQKYGLIIGKGEVEKPEVGVLNTDVIIVSNMRYLSDIYYQAKHINSDIRIFLWYEYFQDMIPLEQCFI